MKKTSEPGKVALRIAILYLLLGGLWILVSDKLAAFLAVEKDTLTFISMVKGWGYVIVTSGILYMLVWDALRRAKAAETELLHKNREIETAKDEVTKTCQQLAVSEEYARNQFEESQRNLKQVKEYEKKLHEMAYHDQLTGLENRASLLENMREIVDRRDGRQCALLFIDVDNFKYINDVMGHTFGDRMLQLIGDRLKNLAKENMKVYRLGGDEFIILIDRFADPEEIEKWTVTILKELKKQIELDNSILFNTVSIGVSLYPDHGNTMDELLKKADIAVYKAKSAGKNRIVIYNEPMNEAVTERMCIESCLRTALENNEFELYYQPQLDLETNAISGFEALLRWRSRELGLVAPDRFIKIAEDTHQIIAIGEWVLRNACVFLKKLHQAGNKDLSISVNISMLQLLQDDFTDFVFETLDIVYLEPHYLELEITESILMESYETIPGKLKTLREHGVKIALDDFGKGYSSLTYLRNLPISTLKIDKTFIDTISGPDKNKSLTDHIVNIGKSMDLCVIAEGVETQEQLDYLKEHKCTKIQGYLFSRPLPEKDAYQKIIA
jgi:diguanylate cyclase (GGDEF)-like protein